MIATRLAGAAMIITALAGCYQGPADGPGKSDGSSTAVGDALNLGYDEGAACVPAPEGVDVTFGDTMLRQDADQPVTISEISLVDADNITLRDAYLVEVEHGETLVGFRHASDEKGVPKKWDERIEAQGAVLEPGDAWNLVIVAESPDGAVATAEAARVHYTTGGDDFIQDTLTKIVTAKSCDGILFD
jgi:hypothetical protein